MKTSNIDHLYYRTFRLLSQIQNQIDRIRIIVITHILELLQALALSVLALSGQITIYPLAVLVFLHGFIHSFSVPALYGMLPRIISKENLLLAFADIVFGRGADGLSTLRLPPV